MSQFRLAMLLLMASSAAVAASASDSGVPTGATAPTAGNAPQANSKPRSYVTANAAGMVVVVDRTTGSTRALTAEEAQHLAAGLSQLLNQSTDGLVQVRRADGSVSMDLQGRFQNVLLAKKEDDGTITQACVDSPADAAAFFEIDPNLITAAQRSVSQSTPPLDIR